MLPGHMPGDRKCMKKLSEGPNRDLPNTVKIYIYIYKRVKLSLSAQYRHIGGAEV